MKTSSKISICLVIVLMLSVLAACSSPDNKLEGTYTGSYTYDGNEFYQEITFNEDGTYQCAYEKNGQPDESYEGDYEVFEDGVIKVYRSADHSTWNIYKFVDGHLTNKDGDRIYNKK